MADADRQLTPQPLRRVFWALVGLKVALSGSLLLGYLGSPLGAGLALDEESYFAWAQRILAGDLLGKAPFFQDPLYPYVLAAELRISGGLVLAARIFNVVLGVACLVLLERVVRKLFSPTAALVAMTLWLLIGSVALDELTLAKEPLMVALLLGSGAFALEVDGRRPGPAAAMGLLGGALVLARGNFLALLPGVALLAALHWPRRIAALAVGGLVLLPSLYAVRNGIAEGRWSPTTASSGMAFFIGHHPGADGTWTRAPFASGTPLAEMPDYVREASRRAGGPVSATQASRTFAAEGTQFIVEHPADELRLLLRKVRLTLSWDEVPGNTSRVCVRDRFLRALWLAPLPGAVLWPLALAGVIAQRRRRAVQITAGALLLYAATLWATFVVERYRLPLWVGCAVLAPAGFAAVRDWFNARLGARVLPAAAMAVAALVWPVRQGGGARELAHCLALAAATLVEAGRVDEARPLLLEAVMLNPHDSEAAFNLGLVYERSGRWPDAAVSYRSAVDANPRNAPAWWGLGMASLTSGELMAARAAFDAFFATATPEQVRVACAAAAATAEMQWLRLDCRRR